MKTTVLVAMIVAAACPAYVHAAAVDSARLILTFEPGSATGAVMVSLFDSEAAYGGGAPLRHARVDIAGGERTAVFDRLPAGSYAVKAFHDIDGNGRMSTNPFGRPIEPFAFSNNARGNMGPAAWDRARFIVSGDAAQTIDIR